MSDPVLEEVIAELKQYGLTDATIAETRRDPVRMAQLKAIAESRKEQKARTDVALEQGVKNAKAAYEREKNAPLRKPPSRPRYEMLSSFEAYRQSHMQQREMPGRSLFASTYVGLPKESSNKRFDQLERVDIDDLYVSKTHKGSYLICRSVTSAQTMVGTTLLIEDPKGRIEILGLYNIERPTAMNGPDVEEWLPLGTLFAIREPTFKTGMDGHSVLVRVDSPTDIVFLRPNDPLLADISWSTSSLAKPRPSKFDYRAHGNSFFKVKKFILALKAYSDGLAATTDPSARLLLLLNRSQTHLNLDHPYQALQDANAALEIIASTDSDPKLAEKARLRRSKALEVRRLLEQALESYEETLREAADSDQAKEGVERVKRKLRETRTGEYDWKKLGSKGAELFDIGDYTGPVEVRKVAGIGGERGVFTKRAVKAGELLLVEKSFATGQQDLNGTNLAFDLRAGKTIKAACIDLVTKVMHKIVDDPATASSVYGLYGGNTFPPSSEPPFDPLDLPTTSAVPIFVDTARIEAIRSHNSFSTGASQSSEFSQLDSDSSLFPRGSLFNHSCLPNATWNTSGDVLVIRARTDLAADSEVLLSYTSVVGGYDLRKKVLDSICGCECRCVRCLDDRRAGSLKLTRRKELLDVKFKAIDAETTPGMTSDKAGPISKKLVRLIASIETTYPPASTVPRPELSPAYHLVTELLHPIHERDLVDLYVSKALESAGVTFERTGGGSKIKIVSVGYELAGYEPVDICLMHARRISLTGKTRDLKEAKEWTRAAIEIDRLSVGRGKKDFREVWAASITKFGIQDLIRDYFASSSSKKV